MSEIHQPSNLSAASKIEVSPITMEDYEDMLESMKSSYPDWSGAFWSRRSIQKLIEIFPEGQLGVYVDDKVVGCALSIVLDLDDFGYDHTYEQITGNYTFSTHNPKGKELYGIEVFVHPDFRGYRLGRRLYDARKALCENLNLRAVVFGGRLPNYHKYSNALSPKQYIAKVKQKEIYDPVLSFQMANDFHPIRVLKNYMPHDDASMEYAALLEWDNVYFEEKPVSRKRKQVRLGLVQWQMRTYRSLDELMDQVEFFADTVSGYKSDFMLLPELFNAPLLAEFNHLSEPEAIRQVAKYTEPIRERMVDLAIRYNINIVSGSMPLLENGALLNVGYLVRRDGSWDRYEKIHVTPNETRYWGIRGGSALKVFDTDVARIGILICYDVEFPELPRLLAEQGMEILFVPFLTDTQNAYSRVRNCAMARAIENECYVAIAGSVGNLPKVKNMDIQFAQSLVITPCDFAFPTNGLKGEATDNTETVLVVDVDLDLLKDLHHYGSVQNLKNRRTDLYNLSLNPRPTVEAVGKPTTPTNEVHSGG